MEAVRVVWRRRWDAEDDLDCVAIYFDATHKVSDDLARAGPVEIGKAAAHECGEVFNSSDHKGQAALSGELRN